MMGTLGDLDSGALLSGHGTYRTLLWRTWSEIVPPLGFCMLNPSTADAWQDDPTIRRCRSFAHRACAGGIVVVNLSPYRSSSPRHLFEAEAKGIDVEWREENDAQLGFLADRVTRVVAAWGSTFGRPTWIEALAIRTIAILKPRHRLLCLGRTKHGDPRHPLMVPNCTALEPFE